MSQRGSGCARLKLLGEYATHGLGVVVVRPEESHSDMARAGIRDNTTKRVGRCATIDGSDASLWSTMDGRALHKYISLHSPGVI